MRVGSLARLLDADSVFKVLESGIGSQVIELGHDVQEDGVV